MQQIKEKKQSFRGSNKKWVKNVALSFVFTQLTKVRINLDNNRMGENRHNRPFFHGNHIREKTELAFTY